MKPEPSSTDHRLPITDSMDRNPLRAWHPNLWVDVWSDPITRTKLEGRAKLVRLTYADPDSERWRVHFTGDPGTVERTFHPYPELSVPKVP